MLTLRGLITYYVLFFIHLETRRVEIAGITRHPDQYWMEQVARNVTMEEIGFLHGYKKLIQDRDAKFCPEFRQLIESHGIENVRLPARSPLPPLRQYRPSQSNLVLGWPLHGPAQPVKVGQPAGARPQPPQYWLRRQGDEGNLPYCEAVN